MKFIEQQYIRLCIIQHSEIRYYNVLSADSHLETKNYSMRHTVEQLLEKYWHERDRGKNEMNETFCWSIKYENCDEEYESETNTDVCQTSDNTGFSIYLKTNLSF